MMCKALLIWPLDSAQSIATCFCARSCPTVISVSTCSGNSYTVHFFPFFFFFINSLYLKFGEPCTNHCQVPLARFLECMESFFFPQRYNKSFIVDRLAGHHCILSPFSRNDEQTSYWDATCCTSYENTSSAKHLQVFACISIFLLLRCCGFG